MHTIRLASEDDAAILPDIERSSGEAFRHFAGLEWVADDTVIPPERHIELIRLRTAWVAEDDSRVVQGFLTGEVRGDAFHIWQMSVRFDRQQRGIGRDLIQVAERWAQSNRLTALRNGNHPIVDSNRTCSSLSISERSGPRANDPGSAMIDCLRMGWEAEIRVF